MTDENPVYKPHVVQKELMLDFNNFKSGFENARAVQVNTGSGFIFTQDNELLIMIDGRITVLSWFNPTGYTDEQLFEKVNNLLPPFLKK